MNDFSPEDRVFTAMCIWEALLGTENHLGFEYSKEQVGWAATRSIAGEFAEPCNDAWEYANKHLGYDDSFDWDWVPRFMTHCISDEFQLRSTHSKTLAELVMEKPHG
jgi:hypothetical protein